MTDTDQQHLDVFAEMNRYDDRDADWKSSAVYEAPRRTLNEGWMKFHADRNCGHRKIAYVENTSWRVHSSEKSEYQLRCWECGHGVREDEVLFVGGEWYNQNGWRLYGRGIENLYIPPERVLDLGADPEQDELVAALEISRIEREAQFLSPINLFDTERWRACEECGQDVPLRFDDRCRICYDGPWTDRLQGTLDAFEDSLRVQHNDSFVHRVERKIDPLQPGGTASPGTILWRRHDSVGTSKLVEVTGRLEDQDDGHVEYVLIDPTDTNRWQYHEEDIADLFWDTGLRNDEPKAVMDDQIRGVVQHLCEHSWSETISGGFWCHRCRLSIPSPDDIYCDECDSDEYAGMNSPPEDETAHVVCMRHGILDTIEAREEDGGEP